MKTIEKTIDLGQISKNQRASFPNLYKGFPDRAAQAARAGVESMEETINKVLQKTAEGLASGEIRTAKIVLKSGRCLKISL